MLNIIPIILCGGKGSRLWPLSRQSYPKQFLSLYGENQKSLLQQTLERLNDLEKIDNPIIICNEDHRFLVAQQMRDIGIKPKAIILEPEGKNTAPAIALGAIKSLEDKNQENILVVLSADHIIREKTIFQKVLKKSFDYAQIGHLVTFGIVPYYPETGYGYIESELIVDKNKIEGFRIKKFIEKPNKDLAKKLVKDKKYTWNSGIFIFKANQIIEELEKYSPLVIKSCREAIEKSVEDLDFIRIDKESFSKVPNIAIDVAVMEKTDLGLVMPLDAGWSDIGSWKSLWESEKKDNKGNVIKGKIINLESSNSFIMSENRLLVTLGIKDLIVVETGDATLISSKNHTEKLKTIVNELEQKGYKEGSLHQKIYRPWGAYTSLIDSQNWLVKKIEVNPGSKLSLQMHNHRAEHWVVVSGIAKIEINEKEFTLKENQSTFIPLGAKHRLFNPGDQMLIIIEIQSGDYIGEDDIIRFKDDYGREKDSP